ncbi:MAG: insulinase family protein [Clostridia bacterium]|nr:insulinase family protein [Clostridia bacterium]
MIPTRLKIADNIYLSVIRTDKFKSGLLTFTVNLPLTKENIAYNMLLTSVLKRGTESYPTIAELNRRLDELYSSSMDIRSARLGKNLTLTVSADMLDSSYIPDDTDVLGGVLELIAETVYKPKLEGEYFPEAKVEQEKRFLTDSINAVVNNTRSYASSRLSELMFAKDEEFPTLEELKDTVASINNVKLTDFYRDIWRHSPLQIFYVGSLSEEELAKRISALFSPWSISNEIIPTRPYPEPICEYKAITERMPVSQGKLAIGFKMGICIGDERQYAAIVLNELFGGSAASKLFLNVRERLSLCYYCSSSYDRYTGTLTVSSGIENKNREIAERAILSELNDIKTCKISQTELDSAKKSLLNGYRQIYDSPYDLQSYYANRGFFGFTDNIETAKQKVLNVTANDISELAKMIVCDSVFFVEGASSSGKEEAEYDE